MKRLALYGSLAILVMLFASPAYAIGDKYFGTTDLNMIPITDTLEEGTAQWDLTARFNDDLPRGRRVISRVYVGLLDNVEFGMRWGINRQAGPVQFAGKWKIFDEYEGHLPVSLAVGFDGATGNYQRTGYDPTYYAVLGVHDVHLAGWWDWYVGFANNPTGFDDEDNSIFGGTKFWINDRWQFNADYYGYADNEEFILTGGLNYDLVKHIELQGFVEYDSVTEDT
ncbi:MAG TPA: hypothetical protein VGB30_01385, partial [bacterium]